LKLETPLMQAERNTRRNNVVEESKPGIDLTSAITGNSLDNRIQSNETKGKLRAQARAAQQGYL
jgi:hypothetical protein